MVDWSEHRAQHLTDPEQLYLNTGSYGCMHRRTYEALLAGIREVELNPTMQNGFYMRKVAASRAKVAAFLGAPAEDLAFTLNVTASMNMAILGLDWQPGDELLASDLEYGAIDNCIHHAAARHGIEVRRAHIPAPPPGPEAIVAAFREKITERTRLLVCSHIFSRTGTITPIRELAALAHEHGALIAIDGAHAPGMIPVQLEASGCDLYGGNCHKWLCSPKGVGFLYATPAIQPRLHHIVVGWGYSHGGSTTTGDGQLRIGERPFMWALEQWGSRDLPSLAAASTAVQVQQDIGPEAITARGHELAMGLRQRLESTGWAQCLTSVTDDMTGSLTAYRLDGFDGLELRAALHDRYRITAPAGLIEGYQWLRVSTHYYNEEREVDALMQALTCLREEAG